MYAHGRAQHLADLRGWTIAPDGEHRCRVVPSPEPQRIVEQDSISALVAAGTVADKDLTATLLAVDADRLVLLTDVPGVMAYLGTPRASLLPRYSLAPTAPPSRQGRSPREVAAERGGLRGPHSSHLDLLVIPSYWDEPAHSSAAALTRTRADVVAAAGGDIVVRASRWRRRRH